MLFSLEQFTLSVVTVTFLLAGFVKGVIGLGLPTIAMGLLSAVMPPAHAASLLIVPSFVTNIWQLASGPSFAALAMRLWPMMLGVVAGTLAGAGLMQGSHGGEATVALGITLMIYAALGFAAIRFSVAPRSERWLAPLVGVLTGLVTAATGVFVIPALPFLGALGLSKEDLVQALGLSFTVSTVALAAVLAGNGAFDVGTAGTSALALVPALIGMNFGGWVRQRVSEKIFRRWFFLGLFALGLHLSLQAVF